MREENPSENRPKASKFADQNQPPKNNNGNVKANTNFSKMKSSWGSNLVKGFSAADKKTKTRVLQTTVNPKKPPVITSEQKSHQPLVSNSRTKRSLIGDLSCSMYATQVHPQSKVKPLGGYSEDLFQEIDHLRTQLQESKDREVKLQGELSEFNRNPKVLELERELESKKSEIDGLVKRVALLEGGKVSLSAQMVTVLGRQDEVSEIGLSSGVEMEVLELRRLNKELQLQKRSLACTISALESQLSNFSIGSESDSVQKIRAEAASLKLKNQDLCKQVEGLQLSRMNEVEELAYLKWVNSCLRDELRNCSTLSSDATLTPNSIQKRRESICLTPLPYQSDDDSDDSASKRLYLIKKFKKWPITDDDLQQLNYADNIINRNWDDPQSLARRHSISGLNCCPEDLILNKRRISDAFMCSKEVNSGMVSQSYDLESDISKRPHAYTNFQDIGKVTAPHDIEKRALRVPNPPPRPSCSGQKDETSARGIPAVPPPPPPPPPPAPKLVSRNTAGKVQRAPQVVEFYHSLMKRDSRKDCLNSVSTDASEVASVRSSMIGEIENRSSHLLAIKADVETQGEFVNSLIREVNDAVYEDIEDVVAFVKWLDDELCFLVDERAVLKHFDWPEKKADTLREAAFGYRDLKKLEQEISKFKDDPRLPCDIALKKMSALSERMERTVYNILRTRDSLIRHFKEFLIPTDWMLDVGILSKIKFGSVKLAKMYMKRVAMELQCKGTSDKDSSLDYMLLQGVRFAFRIHQFAGGFNVETMHAFEELRDLAVVLNKN